jgi:hypothetical protein
MHAFGWLFYAYLVCDMKDANFTTVNERIEYAKACSAVIPTPDESGWNESEMARCVARMEPNGYMSCVSVRGYTYDMHVWTLNSYNHLTEWYDNQPTPDKFQCKLYEYYGDTREKRYDYVRRCVELKDDNGNACVVHIDYEFTKGKVAKCAVHDDETHIKVWTPDKFASAGVLDFNVAERCELPCIYSHTDEERVECMKKCLTQSKNCVVTTIDKNKNIQCLSSDKYSRYQVYSTESDGLKTFDNPNSISIASINPDRCTISHIEDTGVLDRFEKYVNECVATIGFNGVHCFVYQENTGDVQCVDRALREPNWLSITHDMTLEERCGVSLMKFGHDLFFRVCLHRGCTPLVFSKTDFRCLTDNEVEWYADHINEL